MSLDTAIALKDDDDLAYELRSEVRLKMGNAYGVWRFGTNRGTFQTPS